MRLKNFFKGVLILLAGGLIFWGAGRWYVDYKGWSWDELAGNMFQERVEKVLNGENKIIYVSTYLPEALQSGLEEWAENKYMVVYFSDGVEEDADNVISIHDFGDYDLAWKRYYVPVVSVKSSLSGITQEQFDSLVAGNTVEIGSGDYELIVSSNSERYLKTDYSLGVSVPVTTDVVSDIYEDVSKIGFISFEELSPKVKVVSLGEQNLITGFDEYPFVEEVWVKEDPNIGLFDKIQEILGDVNFDSDTLSSVVVTGTSVMGARGLYIKSQEVGDPIYPIREIADVLKSADIAHISNESVFLSGCTQRLGTLVFCGTLESFEAFTFAGVDVVGLTGNHILDYGDDNFLATLDLYTKNNIQYFGGGVNFKDAHTPAVVEVKGMTFAFLGYNIIPPVSSFATDTEPGCAELDMDQMLSDIQDASGKYDFLLIDMQWGNEYESKPLSYQEEYGRAAIDAGADIVTGVHPHWVQKMEYYKDGVIFYGIGNLLFDQMWSQRTREGLMVKHYFYNGKYLGFDLIPTIVYEGAQPRPVGGDDAERIINYLF